MKICTITCHNCYNYGAVLQSYALQQFILKLGEKSEVIDYVPEYMNYNIRYKRVPERWSSNIVKKIMWCGYHHIKIAMLHQRRKKFEHFLHSYVRLTKRYSNYNELVNDPPQADIYVCGSDQIWNGIDYQNGKDPAFFLQFGSEKTLRASYAASFGRTGIENDYFHQIKKYLSSFKFLSVREHSGIEIISDLGYASTEVVDPVFLIDKQEWGKLAGDSPRIKEPYVLVYSLDSSSKAFDIVSQYTEKYKIVSIGEISLRNKGVGNDKNAGPIEFLNYIKYADYIVTNSFHCVAFSLIFGKKFTVFNRNSDINNRINNLLSTVGLNEYSKINSVTKECVSLEKTGYKESIEKSKQFILQILKEGHAHDSTT